MLLLAFISMPHEEHAYVHESIGVIVALHLFGGDLRTV